MIIPTQAWNKETKLPLEDGKIQEVARIGPCIHSGGVHTDHSAKRLSGRMSVVGSRQVWCSPGANLSVGSRGREGQIRDSG